MDGEAECAPVDLLKLISVLRAQVDGFGAPSNGGKQLRESPGSSNWTGEIPRLTGDSEQQAETAAAEAQKRRISAALRGRNQRVSVKPWQTGNVVCCRRAVRTRLILRSQFEVNRG